MIDTLLIDLGECARQLGGVSTRTVRRLLDRAELRARRVGRRLMVTTESLQAYLDPANATSDNRGRVGPDVRENHTCRNTNDNRT